MFRVHPLPVLGAVAVGVARFPVIRAVAAGALYADLRVKAGHSGPAAAAGIVGF